MAEGFEGAQSAVKDKMETVKSKALDAASTGKNRLADKIDEIGDKIDERISVLEQQGGVAGRAAPIVQKASSAADATAEYLRNNELDAIRDDLVTQIQARPLLSVGIAFGAGVVLGQMFGGSDDEEEDKPRGSRKRGSHKRSFLASQIKGPLGAALMSSLTGMITTQVRDRIAGVGVSGREDGQSADRSVSNS